MVSRWSSAFTRNSLEGVLICLQLWSQRRLRLVWNGSRDDLYPRHPKDVFQKTFSRPPEDVFLQDVLKTSPGKRLLENVLTTSWRKVVATSFSDQSKTSLRTKLIRFYDVFMTSLCRLGLHFETEIAFLL